MESRSNEKTCQIWAVTKREGFARTLTPDELRTSLLARLCYVVISASTAISGFSSSVFVFAMLVVHPASLCDVCLDPYNISSEPANSPHVIACGHIFCLTCVLPTGHPRSFLIHHGCHIDVSGISLRVHVPSAEKRSSPTVSKNCMWQVHPNLTVLPKKRSCKKRRSCSSVSRSCLARTFLMLKLSRLSPKSKNGSPTTLLTPTL